MTERLQEMTDKFQISNLSSAASPMTGADLFAVENSNNAYQATFEDIAKDILSNRLALKSGRKSKKGNNVLSVMFVNDNGTSALIQPITLQDGILSSVMFDESTQTIVMKFNALNPSEDDISVSMSSLVDVYYPGFGLSLDDDRKFNVEISAISDCVMALDGEQTINGLKSFQNGICLSDKSRIDKVTQLSSDIASPATSAEVGAVPSIYAVKQYVEAQTAQMSSLLTSQIFQLCSIVSAFSA